MKTAVILVTLLVSSLCLACSGGSGQIQDQPGAYGGTQAVVKQFDGWLLITSDRDWREQWNTPQETIPRFTEAKHVQLGQPVTILTFYTNPRTDERNHINITCDIMVIRPDEQISFAERGIACADEELVGDPGNTRLAYAVVDYIGEPGDPYGTWTVAVTLRDHIGDTAVDLEEYFELINTSTFAGGGIHSYTVAAYSVD